MFLSKFRRYLSSRLQLKMTLLVASAVSIVSALMFVGAEIFISQQLEQEIDNRLDEAMTWTIKMVDQRMVRIECATKTIAAVACDYVKEESREDIDTMLCRMVRGMECIDLASLVVDNGPHAERDVYYAFRDGTSGKKSETALLEYNPTRLDDDVNWKASYKEGKSFWSGIYSPTSNPDSCYVCFSCPVYDLEGNRCGMLCSQILYRWISDIVSRYKARKDIDVAVMTADGSYILSPEIEVGKDGSDNYIQRTQTLPHTGWKLIFTADKRVINKKMNALLLYMALGMLILLVTVVVTIILVVRYVARPFVMKQKHIAETKAVMQRELDIAAKTQRNLVPHTFPPFPDRKEIDVHAYLQPARQVGGDLYDYFIKDDMLYFCIGDVSGKGVPASLFMSATHYLFRSVAANTDMETAMGQINQSLCTDNAQCLFVTFWFGRLDLRSGALTYVNAGHNSPMLYHDGSVSYMPQTENMPLGVWEEEEYVSHTITLDSGDVLLLYTDGVTEAMDSEGHVLGNKAALDALNNAHVDSVESIIDSIVECVCSYTVGAEQSDDITMLCIKKN